MSAISVFQVKFNEEFTRKAVSFFNRIANGKLNNWAKPNVLYSSEPRRPLHQYYVKSPKYRSQIVKIMSKYPQEIRNILKILKISQNMSFQK